MEFLNPFEYDAAFNLPDETIFDVFIPDHNYSRFIESKRNIFVLGERGSGKSISLLYNSLKVQRLKLNKAPSEFSFDLLGIFVPCNNPLYDKDEHCLYDKEFKGQIVSQHFFSLHLAQSLVDSISYLGNRFTPEEEKSLFEKFEYVLNVKLFQCARFTEALSLFIEKESCSSQADIISSLELPVARTTYSFASLVHPLIKLIRTTEAFKNSHFNFLIDDAHMLNEHQQRALNSLVSYRDHTAFSFKVAITNRLDYTFLTATRGEILEGHDFVLIDLEKEFQNPQSPFGKLARDIVKQRLTRINCFKDPDEFFPFSQPFLDGIEAGKEQARVFAIRSKGYTENDKIADYVYKMGRALYFRSRDSKSNRPPYSGFETIVHASTGIVRNLLIPCHWMFDSACSDLRSKGLDCSQIDSISPTIQSQVFYDRSQELWDSIDSLSTCIDGCDQKTQERLKNLFVELGVLFKKRLLSHASEPRAISFTISGFTDDFQGTINPVLETARKARLLYYREGPSKDDGKRERYYVPNRLLWIARGLDPFGQFARVSLKATDLIAAMNGKPFPYSPEDQQAQGHLWDA